MRTFAVLAVSCWSGFLVMALELLSGRILAPTFGSSIYVWGAVITVFMVALSVPMLGEPVGMHPLDGIDDARVQGAPAVAVFTATRARRSADPTVRPAHRAPRRPPYP